MQGYFLCLWFWGLMLAVWKKRYKMRKSKDKGGPTGYNGTHVDVLPPPPLSLHFNDTGYSQEKLVPFFMKICESEKVSQDLALAEVAVDLGYPRPVR